MVERAMPSNATMKQAFQLAESLMRGQRHAWGILKTVVKSKTREVA